MVFESNLGIAFARVATEHADRPALRYPADGREVSYRELNVLVGQVAGRLREHPVVRGDVVAIFHDKSPLAFATMLACLRLGVIYTCLDPESPWERLRKIMATCQPRLVVNAFADLPHEDALGAAGFTNVLHLRNAPWDAERPLAAADVATADADVSGGAPAYIMFTSGSTGMPKGATISHANLHWFVEWSRTRFGISERDVLTNVNPIYFDNSVFDFYSAIFCGAALVPVTTAQAADPRTVVRLVNSGQCTVWFSVPSMLVYLLTTRALTGSDFRQMRTIGFGGEGFPKPKLKALFDMFGDRVVLENVYGPTECTCICSAHQIGAADFDDMQNLSTLGHLAQNFSYEIEPLEASDPDFGELYLGGPHVGLGYFNDRERTEQSFVQNPRHVRYQDLCYRTGDLVRRDERGNLHFKGRVDFQIKHMGYRIELEEIEAAISTLPGVSECAVIYNRLGDGLGEILAFVAMAHAGEPERLVEMTAAIVPRYMVPRRVTVLEVLPKNANGKIDRVALQSLVSGKGNA